MGHGNVAVGECVRLSDQIHGIAYLPLDRKYEIGEDTTHVYPPGSSASGDNLMASVFFSTPESIDQTIGVLREIQANAFPDVVAKRLADVHGDQGLVYRLRKRAEIRQQISTRKSVQEGKPDRLAELLEEAAVEIERLAQMVGR